MTEIIIAIIGSGALASAMSMIVGAIQKRSKLRKLEKDTVRLQLLFLMYVIPDETQELMTVAQYYFTVLKANWYMTTLFTRYLKTHDLDRPDWFKGGEE